MKPYYKEAFAFLNSFHPISESAYDIMYNLSTYREIKVGETLLNLGVVPQKIYFIANGVIRSYILLSNGKEVTTSLYNPFMFFGSFRALLNKEPTNLTFEALTACNVFEVDFNAIYELCKKDINLMTLYGKFLEYIILRSEARFIELSSKNATERYMALRARIPHLDAIIPQYQIAACLSITPVQLSRIRAKL